MYTRVHIDHILYNFHGTITSSAGVERCFRSTRFSTLHVPSRGEIFEGANQAGILTASVIVAVYTVLRCHD